MLKLRKLSELYLVTKVDPVLQPGVISSWAREAKMVRFSIVTLEAQVITSYPRTVTNKKSVVWLGTTMVRCLQAVATTTDLSFGIQAVWNIKDIRSINIRQLWKQWPSIHTKGMCWQVAEAQQTEQSNCGIPNLARCSNQQTLRVRFAKSSIPRQVTRCWAAMATRTTILKSGHQICSCSTLWPDTAREFYTVHCRLMRSASWRGVAMRL